MSRTLLLAAILSLLIHAGVAVCGQLLKEKPAKAAVVAETPTIELELPPPPEPEEPETFENEVAGGPAEASDLAPPMLNDAPTAPYDAPFVQQTQPPAPPGFRPSAGSILPVLPPRPGSGTGTGLGKIFNLGDLDEKPEMRFRPQPIYPFEMRRSGIKGEVKLEFIVDAQGNVRDPVVLRSSHPGFEQAAIDTILRAKFKPGKKGGAPKNTRVTLPVTFSLTEN